MRRFSGFLVVAVSALGAASASAAAMNAYLKIEGVPGESAAHPGWIEVNSFQWGVGRGISSPTGGSADREASSPSVSEITVTKAVDKASPKLKACVATRCHLGTVELMVRKAGGGESQAYQDYVLNNAWVSRYSMSSMSSGGDRPTESVSFKFAKVEMKYNEQRAGPRQTMPMKSGLPPPGPSQQVAPSSGLPPPGH
jgi:type VI secretion system secreted protein Hcp